MNLKNHNMLLSIVQICVFHKVYYLSHIVNYVGNIKLLCILEGCIPFVSVGQPDQPLPKGIHQF